MFNPKYKNNNENLNMAFGLLLLLSLSISVEAQRQAGMTSPSSPAAKGDGLDLSYAVLGGGLVGFVMICVGCLRCLCTESSTSDERRRIYPQV